MSINITIKSPEFVEHYKREIMNFKIKKKEEIALFFQTLGNEGIPFHPDKDFNSYLIKETGAKRFTYKEVELRCMILQECFSFCNENQLNIYKLYREVFKIDVEARLKEYLPVLFEILDGRAMDWKSINKKFDKIFDQGEKDFAKGKKMQETNLYGAISASLSGNKQATRLLEFFRKLLEELNDQLGEAKALINKTLYGLVIEFDLNFFNYVAELAVLNQLLKSNIYSLNTVESPLGNGNSADFLLNKPDSSGEIMVEVVSIRPRKFPETDDKIIALIDQKINEKISLKTKGDPKYLKFILVPVIWGNVDELNKIVSLINNRKILPRSNVLELCGYCTFSDDENQYNQHRFRKLTTLFNNE